MIDILGIGTIFAGGRGIESFEDALINSRSFAAPDEKGRYACRVSLDGVTDPSLKKIRRADKLSKMAVLAASEAASFGAIDPADTGVIVSTALGAHVTTFEFLDDILDYGDAGVSPTTFSNSVHNAAASYISSVLGIQGPTVTITEFAFSLHHALVLAGLWIGEGRCKHVLVGGVEQYGEVLGHVAGRMLHPSERISPFGFNRTGCVPGEGAAFFLLGPQSSGDAIARIAAVGFDENAATESLLVIDTDGMLPDESGYLAAIPDGMPVASYSPVFGSSMSSSAFHLTASALMLRRGAGFPNPVTENPSGIKLYEPSPAVPLKSIRCLRLDCAGSRGWISLKKP